MKIDPNNIGQGPVTGEGTSERIDEIEAGEIRHGEYIQSEGE